MKKETITTEQIKELRTSRKMTQVEFASLLDVQPVTVSRWERGTKPSKPMVKALKKLG